MHHLKTAQTVFFFVLIAFANPFFSVSSTSEFLTQGSSLSVERPSDIIVSPDRTFSAGFHGVGDNAFCFAVWFTKSVNFIPVWMANRDLPVNGRYSTLSLQKGGNLVLKDIGRYIIWETHTASDSPVQLRLMNNGNLMLQNSANITLWQSFKFPTDTLLPQQQFTKDLKLVASRGQGNYSSGFYSFFFGDDNVLRLRYDGPNISSIYWPDLALLSWDVGRSTYNSSRIAMFTLSGDFLSSDRLRFYAADFGLGPKRRLTIDYDGNLRLYSLDENRGTWSISWQAISNPCTVHGLCGPNSICVHASERRCSCLPGFTRKDQFDWSLGCEPTFNLSYDPHESRFLTIPNTDFYGYDLRYNRTITFQGCMNRCLEFLSCKAFKYSFGDSRQCYLKGLLLNGFQSSRVKAMMHIKVPKNGTFTGVGYVQLKSSKLNCENFSGLVELARIYEPKKENNFSKYLLWFAYALGGLELICMAMARWYLFKNKGPSATEKGYVIAATGFKRFSYTELKEATKNFGEAIGRGGAGVVYKGVLSDERVVAVKRLEGVSQGEAEFLAEVSIIGRINHMNLIRVWGFCAEKKHRLLVYEYTERGSLAENLLFNALDWEKRFEIAVGTAKGLAYLHEECLEWVLHCDVKPQNILLDVNYVPKVADFGLSKIRDRCGSRDLTFSRIRGTRGYMAPEWILNQPITSKVDVYSYGIVLLELITGRSSYRFDADYNGARNGKDVPNLVTWVRGMMQSIDGGLRRIEDVTDSKIDSRCDVAKMEILLRVALQCVEEDKDARPTMTQVVEMLLHHEYIA